MPPPDISPRLARFGHWGARPPERWTGGEAALNNEAFTEGRSPGATGRTSPSSARAFLILATRGETFDQMLERARARRGVALMGVCNVTPDSFSDGGETFTLEGARARVDELLAEGADFVDIGAESTRPGRPAGPCRPSSSRRVLEVVRYAATRGACVSIDTARPEVAAACLDAGAVRGQRRLLPAPTTGPRRRRRRRGAALVLMHARGPQEEMRGFSRVPRLGYGDVVVDVVAEWMAAAERAMARGVSRRRARHGPGARLREERARRAPTLLRRTGELARRVGVPVLVGASRKSFLTVVDPARRPDARLGASIAAALLAAREGASILRVHDVRATRQAIDLARLLGGEGGRASCMTSSRGSSTSSQPRPLGAGRHRHLLDIAIVTYVVYRALARPPRHARDADGHRASGVIGARLRRRRSGRLHHPLQPPVDAPLVDHPHRRRRLPERHPPRPHARRRARVLRRHHARAGVARHRRGRRGGDRARAAPDGGAHLLRAGREPRRVRGGAGDGHRRGGPARAARGDLRAGEREQAPRRRGRHPQPPHRQGRGLLPDARHQDARQVARVAPPGRARHHRGDRRRRRGRLARSAGPSASASTATSSRNLDGASLRQALLGLFGQKTRGAKKRTPVRRPTPTPVSSRAGTLPSPAPPVAAGIPTPLPSGPPPLAPARDGNTGSVILPRAARDSVIPPSQSVPSRPLPRVVSKTDPGAKLMPSADIPPSSGDRKDEG